MHAQARKLEAQVAKLESAVASATTAAAGKASKAEAKAAETKAKAAEAKMKKEIEQAEAKGKVIEIHDEVAGPWGRGTAVDLKQVNILLQRRRKNEGEGAEIETCTISVSTNYVLRKFIIGWEEKRYHCPSAQPRAHNLGLSQLLSVSSLSSASDTRCASTHKTPINSMLLQRSVLAQFLSYSCFV